LRLIISAGAPCAEKVHSAFKDKYGVNINELYGSTETGALTLNLDPDSHGINTCGMPLPGIKVEILSDEGELLPPGEVGEVWVQSPTATSAYDGLPEVTADCFVDGKVFLGDMGKLDDHGLRITGRKKLLVNVAGNKVDPLEVEKVLNQHTNVVEAVVVGKPHEVTGEQLKAYIVARDSSYPVAEYSTHLREQLVDYKIPKELVHIDEIPKSPVGKILRKYL
jgi:long-chain acyl-CoA synthetase